MLYVISMLSIFIYFSLLRLKDRFVGHFGDITKENKEKPISKHFSQEDHNGIDDVRITIRENATAKSTSHDHSDYEWKGIGLTLLGL